MTTATILALAAEEAGHGNVAAETFVFGLVAMVIFTVLALVTLSYRNVANRHIDKAEAYARAHANDMQQAGHGH